MFVMLKRPLPGIPTRIWFGPALVFGFTDATSNEGRFSGACTSARRGGPLAIPTATGPATASAPAFAMSVFFHQVSTPIARPLMMCSIRFSRFAPVTPAMQSAGASSECRHVLRMLSAYRSGSLPEATTISSQARSRSSTRRAPIHHTSGWNQKSV